MLKLLMFVVPVIVSADTAPLIIPPGQMVAARVQGMPARLRVDPGAPSLPVFTPDFARRAAFDAGWIDVEARIGPVKVPGETAVVRFDMGAGEFKRRVAWFNAPFIEGSDGTIGPGGLPAPVVRFDLRAAQAGERSIALPLASFGAEGMGVRMPLGGRHIEVLFAPHRERTIATASAGATIAAARNGAFDGAAATMVVHFGIRRPVRHLALGTPLAVGPLALTGLTVRTADFGSTNSIPDAAAVADPDEVVVVGKKKAKELTLEIGRDYLDRCSSIVFDKPARTITLSCR